MVTITGTPKIFRTEYINEAPGPEADQQAGVFTTGTGETSYTAYGFKVTDPGSHSGESHSLMTLQNRPVGSGANGPSNADYGLIVSNLKTAFTSSTVVGEMNGIYSVVRQAGAGSDGAAYLADVATYGTGFIGIMEGVANTFTGGGAANPYGIGVQLGILDNVSGNYMGLYAVAKEGAQTANIWVNTQSTGTVSYMFRGQKLGIDTFTVDGNGSVFSLAGFRSNLNNTSTNTPSFTAEQTGTGDAIFQWLLTGTQAWVAGIDNSDSDAWKLAPANNGFTAPALRVSTTGAVQAVNATGGLGYGTGAGGTVTQITSKATGVTLNKVTGQITTHNANLTTLNFVNFVVTNSAVAATDLIILNIVSGATLGNYEISVTAVAAGSFTVSIYNRTAVTLGEAIVIGFAVIKGVTA